MLRAALIAAASVTFLAACTDAPPPERSASETKGAAFKGVYTAKGEGTIGDFAVADDGTYVLRPSACRSDACLEAGTATFDAKAKTLTLSFGPRVIHVDVRATTGGAPRATSLTTRDEGLVGDGGAPLVEEAGVELATTITEADLDGEPVELLTRAPLRQPQAGEVVTVHPSGNAVTVAVPGDRAFARDAQLAAGYAGVANIYNSHGFPGILYGTVPGEEVRRFLNESDQPLIVAACFGAAGMSGGSTIRRLVNDYANDPAAASRVYGCTGWAYDTAAGGYGCTGHWVDANQQAVPLVERTRLRLTQQGCHVNTVHPDRTLPPAQREIARDCD